MAFCHRCGNRLPEGAAFCNACGTAQARQAPPKAATLVPTVDPQAEEQEFLEWTHRLLRWERKAWSIAGKFYLIFGIVFMALLTLISIIMMAADDILVAFGVVYFIYTIIIGGGLIALGIVNQKAAEKIPFYLDNLYTDVRFAVDRCGNVGMLIFNVLLGTVSPVFFIINFVRMKTNKNVINRIIARQQQF